MKGVAFFKTHAVSLSCVKTYLSFNLGGANMTISTMNNLAIARGDDPDPECPMRFRGDDPDPE